MERFKLPILYPGQWIASSYYFVVIFVIFTIISFQSSNQSENSIPSSIGKRSSASFIDSNLSSSSVASSSSSSSSLSPANDDIQSDQHYSQHYQKDSHLTRNECFFVYDEIETGFISSPHFPDPFPVPIHCTWIIRAPIGNVIVLYWTQFYLTEGFRATEYAFYLNSTLNAGSTSLVSGFTEGDPAPLVTSKPVLVLEMDITDDRNIYLRSMDWFLNVFGFNVTFTIVPFTVGSKVIADYCSVYKCSFNGQCYSSRDTKVQYCSCFPAFFGRYCQYGPKCNPSKGINPCKDGTDCRYFAGSHFTKCSTADSFLGEDRSRITPNNVTKTGFQILKIGIEGDVTPTEDTRLTLSCLIQSTHSIEVKWYKDFTLIDIESSFLRKMTTTLKGQSSGGLPSGRYLASLTLDRLYPLDSGIFTCEATYHLDQAQKISSSRINSSYELKVLTKPQVKVYPLCSTVFANQSFTVSCFSVDYDPLIGYNWLKNGEMLNPLLDSEIIEDLYPAGIRLIVPKALTRAVYTCLVTTPMGTVGKESMLTVIPSNLSTEFRQTCPKETHEDIDWPETATDGIAVEPCPPGYKDGGVARRRCFTHGKWDEADFSNCLNYQMFYIQEKLMSLTLGYHLVSHSTLMNQLKDSLNGLRLRPSQGHFIIHLLESLMAILKLTMDSMETHESSQLALDIISSLLNKPESINNLTGLSNLHRLLMEYSLLASKIVKGQGQGQGHHQITRSNFVVEIFNLDQRLNLFMPSSTLKFPTLKASPLPSSSSSSSSSSTTQLHNNKPTMQSSASSTSTSSTSSTTSTIPSWLTDSVQIDINSLPGYGRNKSFPVNNHSNDQLKSVLTVFYQNLTSFLPKNVVIHKDFTDEEYQIHSKVVTVALVHRAHYIPSQPYPLRVTAHLKHHPSAENNLANKKVTCGLAQLNERLGFQTKHCSTSQTPSDSQSTICVCDITGAYSVLVTSQYKHTHHQPYHQHHQRQQDSYSSHLQQPQSQPKDGHHQSDQYDQQQMLLQQQQQLDLLDYPHSSPFQVPNDYFLIASFSLSTGLIFFTIMILLVRSRFKLNSIKCLKIQICLATIGLECSLIASYYPLNIPIPTVNILQLILFFQLACNCLHISLCTNVLACVTQLNYGEHSLPHFKITFLGWVVPLSCTGAAVIANELDKPSEPDEMVEIESRYYYFTNGSAFFMTIIHLILFIILKIKFSDRHRKELLDNFRRIDNGSRILNQSLIIIFWTDFLLTINFYYRNSRKRVSRYTLSALSCLLGLNVILFYGFFAHLDETLGLVPGPSESKEKDSTASPAKPSVNNVYAMNEIDIRPTFHRVTLTEFDVHFQPGIGDL